MLFISSAVMATHNRSGEIKYEHVEGFTYQITVSICVDNSSEVDREYIPILWGDGSPQDSIQRTSGPTIVPGTNGATSENLYITNHTFNGPSSYLMLVEDPNRNPGINNILNSVETVFSIQSLLVIPADPSLGFFNNSAIFFNPPKGDACRQNLYLYNPLAFDPDGDSLSYTLVAPTGAGGEPLENYVDPGEWTPTTADPPENGPMILDPVTGLLSWDAPFYDGDYNIAIKISEYRLGFLVGYTIRDMQIKVFGICDNQPPSLDPLPDTCVVAGSALSIPITAEDPNTSNYDINAFGESFELAIEPSIFATGNDLFLWDTECAHVRNEPYEVLVIVGDNSPQVELFDFDSFFITVIAPPVENVVATTSSNDATITWDSSPCATASGYKIYRRIGSNNFELEYCETGMPPDEGYSLLETIDGTSSNLYIDEDIPFGGDVCYRIVTCFPDGAESIVSEESCVRIDLESPVLVKVSVGVTDVSVGIDSISWSPPLEINVVDFPPPYHYELFVGENGTYPNDLIFTSPPSNVLNEGILSFIHEGINTEEVQYNYRVSFFSDEEFVDTSYPSSSIFLELTPDDNEITLNWNEQVEWINENYLIYRSSLGSDYELIGNTVENSYIDSGLTNNTEYCYYVVSEGGFDDPLIPFDIINYSQTNCSQPWDQTPPCPPTLVQEGTCEEQNLSLSWNNPNNSCADDVTEYNIYYAPTPEDEYQLLQNITSAEIVTYELQPENFVGCFLITALDSLFENPFGELFQNESVVSDTLCIDGCPIYELPNVISANGDNLNDVFMPFPYLSIKDVDMKIFNRWGQLVFETTDPDINWTGVNQDSGELVSDGVYFYVVQVNQITLEGIVPITLSGYLHLLENSTQNSE